MSMAIFDPTELEQRFREDPLAALMLLAHAMDCGALRVRWRGQMPIGGGPRDAFDTFRLTLDVDVRLVQPLPDQPVTDRHQLTHFTPGLDD